MNKSAINPNDRTVTAIDGGAADTTAPPRHLGATHHAFWRRLRHQVQISHNGITPAAEALIDAACLSRQAEHQARIFAAEAAAEGDSILYLKFQSEARAESRSMRGALNGLRLAGDRSSATGKSVVAAVDRATQKKSDRWS